MRKKPKIKIMLILAVLFAGMGALGMGISAEAAGQLLWPVPGHTGKSQGYSSWHTGIDINDSSINGAAVVAATSGTVTNVFKCSHNTYHWSNSFPTCCYGFGTGIVIRGDDGRYYQYPHMQSGSIPAYVYKGAYIKTGQQVGRVGSTGNATGPHLHFAISRGPYYENFVNPEYENYIYSLNEKPNAPSYVSLGSSDVGIGDAISASWPAVSGAADYQVNLICTTNSAFNQSKSVGGTSASFAVRNPGTYQIRVAARNSSGSSSATASGNGTVHKNITVKYVDWDGTVLSTQSVKWGGSGTKPGALSREGYTFEGWSDEGKGLKGDTTITAQYKIKTYSVTFTDYAGNTIGKVQRIEHGKEAQAPADVPVKDGYIFTGWSSEDYKCVKSALTIKAVYVWENVDLPIITKILSAKRNDEATGYDISIQMSNFPNTFTKGKIVTTLKTKGGKMVASETDAISLPSSGELKKDIFVLYSGVASTVEVSLVGVVDDNTTGTPKSKAVTGKIDTGKSWSDWSANPTPSGEEYLTESRTEYRYKDKKTVRAVSKPGTPAGYVYEGVKATGTYTGYGGWTEFWVDPLYGNALTQVETCIGYRYYTFVCPACGTRDPYSTPCSNCGSGGMYWEEAWGTCKGVDYGPGYTRMDSAKGRIYWKNKYWYFEFDGTGNGQGGTGQPTHTLYRRRTRQEYYDYTYWPSNYSSWQGTAVTASDSRKVETRTAYRFKSISTEVPCYNYKRYKYQNLNNGKTIYAYTSAYADSQDYPGEWEYNQSFSQLKAHSTVEDGIVVYNGIGENSWYRADINKEGNSTVFETTSTLEDTQGTERKIEGKVEGVSGKRATLLVYKGKNEDPTASQIEYAGQTALDENGNYSFTFITKEEPSVETGDFVVTLGIEGSTNYMNIGTIEAPKPVYSVEFADEEGNTISEQNVVEGGNAEAPDAPEKEGYEFIGWDTGLKNIHSNMVVMPQYRKQTCTVIFVDWDNTDLAVKQFAYGDRLSLDEIPVKAGQIFKKWIDKDKQEVSVVTQNMIVTASYADTEYIVTFVDWNGDVISEQKVAYGEKAEVPEDLGAPDDIRVFSGWSSEGAEQYVTGNMTVQPVAKFKKTAKEPEFSVTSGVYSDKQKVFLSSDTPKATIYYSKTEIPPEEQEIYYQDKEAFQVYSSPIVVEEDAVVYAYAAAENANDSEISGTKIEIRKEGESISVTDITLNESELALETGETAELTVAVLPKNATDKSVKWKSSDERIASVDQDGTVTAIAPGTAVIEAAARDGSNVKASCTVTVGSEKKEQEISGQNRYEKTFGDEDFSLDAELTAGDGKLTYRSDDEAVAVISDQGKVTIKGAGTTQIRVTASATAQYKKTEKVITLTVKKAVPDLQCSISKEEIKVGQAAKLSISASVEGVLFSSDDESIASVSEDGKVSGISPGTTYLTVTVPESGNYKKAETKIRITVTAQEEAAIDMSECSITLSGKSFVYNGQAKEPEVSVFYNGEQLPQNEYVVFYRNNINPGTAVVSVFAGGGQYTGYKEAEFTIRPQASEGQTEIADGEYKESDLTEIEIKAGVTSIGSEAFAYCMDLTEIHFFGNVPEIAEDAFTEVTAKAYYPASDNTWTLDKLKGYGGSIEWVPWDISTGEVVKRNIAARKIEISAGEYVYTGEAFEPEVIVMDGDLQLTAGTDYTVTYEDHINAGTGKVRIEGTGNYDGVYEQGFQISPQMISDSGVTLSADHFVYSGQAITPKVTVKNSAGNSLVKDTDYQITYATGRTNAGTYSITVSGTGNYSGEIVKKFTVSPQKISPSSVILYTSTFTYNKRTVTPEIFVRNADRKGLVQNRDYQVSYTGNRKNVGTHGITVSGKGNYSGSVTKSFRINPPKTKLSKLNAGKRSVTVKWKKQTQQVSGYQIRYSKKSSMKGSKTVWVKSSKKASRKITRLNSRKRYYFQIRTYKSVNGTKYYSGWSSKKKVTVK